MDNTFFCCWYSCLIFLPTCSSYTLLFCLYWIIDPDTQYWVWVPECLIVLWCEGCIIYHISFQPHDIIWVYIDHFGGYDDRLLGSLMGKFLYDDFLTDFYCEYKNLHLVGSDGLFDLVMLLCFLDFVIILIFLMLHVCITDKQELSSAIIFYGWFRVSRCVFKSICDRSCHIKLVFILHYHSNRIAILWCEFWSCKTFCKLKLLLDLNHFKVIVWDIILTTVIIAVSFF